jgi:hypothetical protein
MGGGVEVEAAAVKVDGGLEVLAVAAPAGGDQTLIAWMRAFRPSAAALVIRWAK